MDLSTLTEAQQQQLQQLHQQFQQHQLEQQQQQQQELQKQQQQQEMASQAYDPSQAQAYDQSNQAYYHYHQQYQHYSYYHSDYANAYHHQSQSSQPDTTAVQPPGISAPTDAAAASQVQEQGQNHHQQQNAYYTQVATEQQQASSSAYPVPSGLNPAAAAAVAALSQLTQFAGTMDAAERAMAGLQERQWPANAGGYGPMPMMPPPPHVPPQGGFHHGPFPGRGAGRPPYRGGGRRGGGPFRGGGHGNFGQHYSRPDGSGSNFRGRGRGKGGSRRFQQRASSSHPETAAMEELASVSEHADMPPVIMGQGESQSASIPTSAMTQEQALVALANTQGQAASTQRQPQIAWCELCRVDCTSLEILEQHKNGKRHKKNLQRMEELQKARNPMAMPLPITMPMPLPIPFGTSMPVPAPASAAVPVSVPSKTPLLEVQNQPEIQPELKLDVIRQPENVVESETNMSEALENAPAKADNDGNKMEAEQKDFAEKPEVAETEPVQAPARKRRFDRFDARRRGMKRNMRGGRGGKRLRALERQSRPVEPPKGLMPIICDLCNVKCDTQAVFDSHLAGKKHISKLKRFQGHQAIYGSVGLQALYPPNPNAPPIFIPPVHQQAFYYPQGPFPLIPYMPPKPQQPVVGSEFLAKQNTETQPLNGSQKVVMLNPDNQQAPASIEQDGQQTPVALEQGGQQAPGAVEHEGQPELLAVEPEGQETLTAVEKQEGQPAPMIVEQEALQVQVAVGQFVEQAMGIESEISVSVSQGKMSDLPVNHSELPSTENKMTGSSEHDHSAGAAAAPGTDYGAGSSEEEASFKSGETTEVS